MMWIPSDIHSAVRHTGGASLIKKGSDQRKINEGVL
ncbi:HNH endonuclease [Heyndrickxia coagulans]|nr:hypothetical protein CYJ15_15320 [Heyndrickxia coagulans]QDI60553.1 hypothetical protein DXF96_02815 [Heyndrickxia coagulans]